MPHDVIGIAPRRAESLPRRERRQLLQLAAAGGLSVIFFVVPLALTRPAAPPPAAAASAAPAEPIDDAVRVVSTTVSADTSVLRFAEVPGPAAPPRRAALRRPERARTASADTRPRFVRRLARLFAGDGRHEIQPFPTVPSTNR